MKENYIKTIFIIFISILVFIGLYVTVYELDQNNSITSDVKTKIKHKIISNDIRIGIIDLDNINPILSNNKHVQEISRLIFEPLFTLTQDYKLEGVLAKEFSKIENKTYIIKLKDDIIWHDGNKFDSSDVIFTINMLKKLGTNSIYYYNIRNINKIQEIDENTIKIITDRNIPYFEYNLIFPILSSKYFQVNNFKSESKNIKPVGTGMFYISEVNNKNILLKKNLKNLKAEKLKLETITVKIYSSLANVIEAFKLKEIDIFTTANKNIEEYLKNTKYNVSKYINREYNYLALNCNSKILSNKEVRKAICYAINKDEILRNVLNNKYEISNFPLDFGSFVYNISNDRVTYDANKAKNILRDNGWKYSEEGWKKVNDSNLIIGLDVIVNKNNIENIKIANNIKEQLARVGILINVTEVNDKEYNKYLEHKNYDMIIINNTYSYRPSLEKYFGEGNLANYSNKEITTLLKEIELFTNENEIKQKYTMINDIYNNDNPYISLYYDTNTIIYSINLRGTIIPNSYNLFYELESWYREYEK